MVLRKDTERLWTCYKVKIRDMQSMSHQTIRSLTHPSAPCRECYRDNISDFFTCLSCESTIAREEQCVHSLSANDFVFIPEQFASRHFRRKFVSGSYISMEHNENEPTTDNIYIDSDDDTDFENDNFTQTTADKDSTVEEQQGAFFEQLPAPHKTVKCLSSSELKNIMDQILGNYSSCSNQVKKTINGIVLSLNEMSIPNGSSNGILDQIEEEENDTDMLNSMIRLISEHRNLFLSGRNNFNHGDSNNSDYMKRSTKHLRGYLLAKKGLTCKGLVQNMYWVYHRTV